MNTLSTQSDLLRTLAARALYPEYKLSSAFAPNIHIRGFPSRFLVNRPQLKSLVVARDDSASITLLLSTQFVSGLPLAIDIFPSPHTSSPRWQAGRPASCSRHLVRAAPPRSSVSFVCTSSCIFNARSPSASQLPAAGGSHH